MPSDKIDSEDAIIQEFLAPLAADFPGALDLEDDCALIAPGAGEELVVTTDALVEGIHFFSNEDPRAIAWKALAVNVSDLVAKGATPLAYLMALALPEAPDRGWLAAFADGLASAQKRFGCRLAGGDTDRTPGHLSVSISAFGTVPAGGMVRRSRAQVGDSVYVSGTIGDAALGLSVRRDPALAKLWGLDKAAVDHILARYRMPIPPTGLTAALRTHASAAMDVSDGLMKDFHRLCRASGTGGRIEAARVPLSGPARAVLAAGGATIADLLTGGEDYEVLATVRPDSAQEFERLAGLGAMSVTRIGVIVEAKQGVAALDAAERPLTLSRTGWDHFQNRDERPRRDEI